MIDLQQRTDSNGLYLPRIIIKDSVAYKIKTDCLCTHTQKCVRCHSFEKYFRISWLASFIRPFEATRKTFELNKVIFWVNYLVLFALPLFLDDKSPSMTWGVLFLWQIFWQRSLLFGPHMIINCEMCLRNESFVLDLSATQ